MLAAEVTGAAGLRGSPRSSMKAAVVAGVQEEDTAAGGAAGVVAGGTAAGRHLPERRFPTEMHIRHLRTQCSSWPHTSR